MSEPSPTCTAFRGFRRLASGAPSDIAAVVADASASATEPVLVFDDATGRVLDLDPRAPGAPAAPAVSDEEEPRGRGRPKLGVVPREVTLLPRHWDWLAAQPGGASVTLRRLIDEARRTGADRDRFRRSQEAAYRFITAIAGDLPGFEEAMRALFAGDAEAFTRRTDAWPQDVADYALTLASGAWKAADHA